MLLDGAAAKTLSSGDMPVVTPGEEVSCIAAAPRREGPLDGSEAVAWVSVVCALRWNEGPAAAGGGVMIPWIVSNVALVGAAGGSSKKCDL